MKTVFVKLLVGVYIYIYMFPKMTEISQNYGVTRQKTN
jgi:hypothetical protein